MVAGFGNLIILVLTSLESI